MQILNFVDTFALWRENVFRALPPITKISLLFFATWTSTLCWCTRLPTATCTTFLFWGYPWVGGSTHKFAITSYMQSEPANLFVLSRTFSSCNMEHWIICSARLDEFFTKSRPILFRYFWTMSASVHQRNSWWLFQFRLYMTGPIDDTSE